MLRVASAEYVEAVGWGVSVKITLSDGVEIVIPFEQKYVREGWVFLGAEWEKWLPERIANLKVNPRARLRGYTDDAVIVAIVQRMFADLDAGKFTPGPVDVPKL